MLLVGGEVSANQLASNHLPELEPLRRNLAQFALDKRQKEEKAGEPTPQKIVADNLSQSNGLGQLRKDTIRFRQLSDFDRA